jgi:hypothetical protein
MNPRGRQGTVIAVVAIATWPTSLLVSILLAPACCVKTERNGESAKWARREHSDESTAN